MSFLRSVDQRVNPWMRAMLESGEERRLAQSAAVDCAVFGALAFWSNGEVLACRVIADGSKGTVGFDIPLRPGAI